MTDFTDIDFDSDPQTIVERQIDGVDRLAIALVESFRTHERRQFVFIERDNIEGAYVRLGRLLADMSQADRRAFWVLEATS